MLFHGFSADALEGCPQLVGVGRSVVLFHKVCYNPLNTFFHSSVVGMFPKEDLPLWRFISGGRDICLNEYDVMIADSWHWFASIVAYENITKRVANALGLPCFTVSKVFNESSNGMFYLLMHPI